MKTFFIVLARDKRYVPEKIKELESLGVPFVVVCGEKLDDPRVVYRKPIGKWDAINFGSNFLPKEADIVVLNDVDTKIYNFDKALSKLEEDADLVYCKVKVFGGPQLKFYKILDPIRKRLHIAASGELMLIRREVFDRALPIPPCLAEDSYLLFKALELGYRAYFCEEAYVTTERTIDAKAEELYKARTTLGIYQALKYSRPPGWIRAFYALLPAFALLLALAGKDGIAWVRGIQRAVRAHVAKIYPIRF